MGPFRVYDITKNLKSRDGQTKNIEQKPKAGVKMFHQRTSRKSLAIVQVNLLVFCLGIWDISPIDAPKKHPEVRHDVPKDK